MPTLVPTSSRRVPAEPPIQRGPDRALPTDLLLIRRCVWLYLILWITEGALRKWIVPGFSTPLLVIRDPLLLIIYYLAFTGGIFPRNILATAVIVLGAIAFLASTAATNTPMTIQLFGLRASYEHLLLIFVIPQVFDRGDVIRLGKWTLLCAGPMAALVLLQFVAGRGSRLNVGAGGAANGMIDSAYGHVRPSGTFSFTNGLGGFTAMSAVYLLYHVLEKRVYPRKIWLAAAPAVFLLIVLSGSRSAAGIVFLIMATIVLVSVVVPRYRAAVFKVGLLVGLLVVVAGSFAVFKQGIEVFAYRFGDASNVRVGFLGRFFGTFEAPFEVADQCPFFGFGLGMGTNVAGGLLYGYGAFLLSESELVRDVMESGPLIGGAYLLLRAFIVLYIGSKALATLRREGHPLPLMVFSACWVDIIMGQFSQATELGYATIAGGLCLAANRLPARVDDDPAPATPDAPPPSVLRGRSAYAERLHADQPVISPENPQKPSI